MYISTYIQNKNCHQHSYRFENLMSSLGSWSKISKRPIYGPDFKMAKHTLRKQELERLSMEVCGSFN